MEFDDLLGVESGSRQDMETAYGVYFHPETGLIIPVSGLGEVGIVLEMRALRGLMASSVASSAINAAVFK